jgi:uncharacterized membrane protein YeaQ/YmgE (transglycosylase-associated protein family)
MGIIAWIVLGFGAGLVANILVHGRRSRGLVLTCLVGIAGALIGGCSAAGFFHVHHVLQGFFNASTWVAATAGAVVLLFAYRLLTGNTTHRPAHR